MVMGTKRSIRIAIDTMVDYPFLAIGVSPKKPTGSNVLLKAPGTDALPQPHKTNNAHLLRASARIAHTRRHIFGVLNGRGSRQPVRANCHGSSWNAASSHCGHNGKSYHTHSSSRVRSSHRWQRTHNPIRGRPSVSSSTTTRELIFSIPLGVCPNAYAIRRTSFQMFHLGIFGISDHPTTRLLVCPKVG